MCLLVCLLFSVSLPHFICPPTNWICLRMQAAGIHLPYILYHYMLVQFQFKIWIEVWVLDWSCVYVCVRVCTTVPNMWRIQRFERLKFTLNTVHNCVFKTWMEILCCFIVQQHTNFNFYMFYLCVLFFFSSFLDCIKWSFYPTIINHLYQIQ